MSRFRKLSQTMWHCQYHIVFVPKYRYRVLLGAIGYEVERCIRAFSEQKKVEIIRVERSGRPCPPSCDGIAKDFVV